MKRIALIVAAAVLLLAGMGGGAYFYLKPGFFARSETPAQASHHKTTAATNAADKKTRDGEDLLHLVRNLGGIQDRIIYGDRDALAEQASLLRKYPASCKILKRRIGRITPMSGRRSSMC